MPTALQMRQRAKRIQREDPVEATVEPDSFKDPEIAGKRYFGEEDVIDVEVTGRVLPPEPDVGIFRPMVEDLSVTYHGVDLTNELNRRAEELLASYFIEENQDTYEPDPDRDRD